MFLYLVKILKNKYHTNPGLALTMLWTTWYPWMNERTNECTYVHTYIPAPVIKHALMVFLLMQGEAGSCLTASDVKNKAQLQISASNLESNAQYDFSLRISRDMGQSIKTASAAVTLKTLPGAPPKVGHFVTTWRTAQNWLTPVPDRETVEGRYLCPWQACATTACSECAR